MKYNLNEQGTQKLTSCRREATTVQSPPRTRSVLFEKECGNIASQPIGKSLHSHQVGNYLRIILRIAKLVHYYYKTGRQDNISAVCAGNNKMPIHSTI